MPFRPTPYPGLQCVDLYGMPPLLKCKFCVGMYPASQLLRSNGEMYGYDDQPIVHSHWSICPARGPPLGVITSRPDLEAQRHSSPVAPVNLPR